VPGVLVVHAGNRIDGPERAQPRFPPHRELAVGDRLGELLDLLAPEGVVTSAAAGADLLLVEAAIKRQVPIHLVLAFPRSQFRAVSVEDQGRRWTASFDAALDWVEGDDASSVVELDLDTHAAVFHAANEALLARAAELCRTGVLAVAVRPPGSEVPPSVTDEFVRGAEEAGLFVLEIDPRG
jgi:hypothetical protein